MAIACASAERATPRAPTAQAAPAPPPPSTADVRFVSGMIPHHAQAVLMTAWAATHGASERVRTMAERISVSQQDEIAFMQRWLRERGQPVPDADPMARHGGHGAGHAGHAPGMLTPEELGELDRARGPEFDRLFLTLMIRHHQGAVAMVEELFRSPRPAQDDALFQFAADVNADQLAEIDRMSRLLAELPSTAS